MRKEDDGPRLNSALSGYSLDGESEPEDALEPFIQQAIDQVRSILLNSSMESPIV